MALGHAVYPLGTMSNKSCSSKFPDFSVVVEVCFAIIIRTTRTVPVAVLALIGEMLLGIPTSCKTQASIQAALAKSITIDRLSPREQVLSFTCRVVIMQP